MRAKPRARVISLSGASPPPGGGAAVYVHVGGAVRHPGLYKLAPSSRVYDAIEAAGGGTEFADLDAVNLAAKVKDGDKVLVPQRAPPAGRGSAPPGAATAAGGGGLVNINSADAAGLDALPGIGPSIAQRIIAYRTEHGGFRTVEELMDVPGIGPAKFADIKDHVTV